MNQLIDYVASHGVEYSNSLVSDEVIKQAEHEIGIPMGAQLKKYLLDYGYMIYGSIEFYGMTARQGLKSDIVTQTLYMHKYFPKTKDMIALENQGEGDYFLVDKDDKVFEYDSASDELIDLKQNLEQYILKRFEENEYE